MILDKSLFTVVLPFTRFLKKDFSKIVQANHVEKNINLSYRFISDHSILLHWWPCIFVFSLQNPKKLIWYIFCKIFISLQSISSIYYLHLPLRKLNQNWCQICKHLLSWDKHKHTNCFDMPVNCVTLPTFYRLEYRNIFFTFTKPINDFSMYSFKDIKSQMTISVYEILLPSSVGYW